MGHFLGLPLDVRQTPCTCRSRTANRCQRWKGGGSVLLGIAGVGVMFVLNLSVSFLALATAARAYELPRHENAAVLRALFRHFRSAPLDFVIPPREERRKLESAKQDAGSKHGVPMDDVRH